MPTAAQHRRRPSLSIEAIVAVDTPREFRLHPRERIVAYTAEVAGTRQLFTLSLRGRLPGPDQRLGEVRVGPQWSPDGRRLAYVRDDEIWVVETDGSRLTRVVGTRRARAPTRAGRPTDAVWRSCPAVAAGPRSG